MVYPKEAGLLRGLSPTWKKFAQWVKSVLLVQSSGVSTGRIQKLCPKQANCRMNPVSTHYGNHSSTNCWLCLGNQSADAIQCIHWLKRNGLRPGEPFCHQFYTQLNMNAVYASECLANRGIHLFLRLLHSKSSKSSVRTM